MNSPFLFNRPLQASEVLGRTAEADWLASNLLKGQHSVIWDNPKTGKSSLINKVLMQIRKSGEDPIICRLSCFNIRSERSLYATVANSLFRCVAGTLGEWEQLAATLLPAGNPEISVPRLHDQGFSLFFPQELTDEASRELARFPHSLALHMKRPVILVIESFHTLIQSSGIASRPLCQRLAMLWKSMNNVTFLISGCGSILSSGYSVFRELFDSRRPFHGFAEHIPLGAIEEKEFTDYIIRCFSKAGRVISRDYAEMIYRKMEGHPYYIQYFADICFSNTKGYMNDAMYLNGMEELLDIFQQPFERICQDLTNPQIFFLHALTDGVEQFSSREVLHKYLLNSSANVYRVRDALEKKAIIEIIRKKPRFIDPLFKLWFKERFCQTYWLP
ncbi:MAG: hypothetical protein WCQ69_06705 [Bacteroidales bacterium]|jgi:hypothetical protein|nr:hypothetical protein [Bacteroidales bacterium]MDD2263831.1 hypothetical protein [Bacteroidales bacterium]MDD2830951.1 hypothetical protein [Bacteroidales bacterium]MDD3208241.1 hypothetical protein [Bacteroidales bacterium]MDD3696717.1 hypothetical protein [Bacteroidales bacterium]